MTTRTTAQIDIIVEEFESHIAALESLIDPNDDAYILAWDNGLCIGFNADTRAYFPTNTARAEVVANSRTPEDAWAYIPQIKNGHGQIAHTRKRQHHIAQEISKLRLLIASVRQED